MTQPTAQYIQGTIAQINKLHNSTRILLKDSQMLYNLESKENKLPGFVRLKIPNKYFTQIKAGDQIFLKASLAPPPNKLIPEGYDFTFYANISNISAIGFALSKPTIIERTNDFFRNLQEDIYQRLISSIPAVPANFISALIIGIKDGLDQKVMQDIRLSGISHLLCISGLHLSLVTMICFNVFRFLLNSSNYLAYRINIKLIAGSLAICCSCFYLLISGCQVSATRAFIMSSITSLAIILQRDYTPSRALGFASLIILSITPGYALHPSFQLSFLAVLSLLAGQNIPSWLKNSSPSLLAKIKNAILANLYSSTLVGFATAPIVAHHFHMFSNYSALANLVAIPITTFILMPCAILFLLLIPFNLDKYILVFMSYFIEPIIKVAHFVANIPYNAVHTGYIESKYLALYLLGLFWLTIWQSRLRLWGILIIAASIALMLNNTKPKLLIDLNRGITAMLNNQGEVDLYSHGQLLGFARDGWALWFGKDKIAKHTVAEQKPQKIALQNNCTIEFRFMQALKNITTNIELTCPEQKYQYQSTRSFNDQTKGRFIFIYPKEKTCKIRFYD